MRGCSSADSNCMLVILVGGMVGWDSDSGSSSGSGFLSVSVLLSPVFSITASVVVGSLIAGITVYLHDSGSMALSGRKYVSVVPSCSAIVSVPSHVMHMVG